MLDLFNNADFPFLSDVEVIYFSTVYDEQLGMRVLSSVIGANFPGIQEDEKFVFLGNGFYGLYDAGWMNRLDSGDVVAVTHELADTLIDVLKSGEQLVSVPIEKNFIATQEDIKLVEMDDLSALKSAARQYILNAVMNLTSPAQQYITNVLLFKLQKHITSGALKIECAPITTEPLHPAIAEFMKELQASDAEATDSVFLDFLQTCHSLILVDIDFNVLSNDEINVIASLLKASRDYKRMLFNVMFDLYTISKATTKNDVYESTRKAVIKIRYASSQIV